MTVAGLNFVSGEGKWKMARERSLTGLEQAIMLAISEASAEASGATIARAIQTATVGGVYAALVRMESGGWVKGTELPPLNRKGGRRRKVYAVTASGLQAIRRSMHLAVERTDRLASVVPIQETNAPT